MVEIENRFAIHLFYLCFTFGNVIVMERHLTEYAH